MHLIGMILFALIQGVLSARRKLQWIPISLLAAGLAVCAAIYFAGAGSVSSSVMAENRYFAMFAAGNLMAGMVGCALGYLLARFRR